MEHEGERNYEFICPGCDGDLVGLECPKCGYKVPIIETYNIKAVDGELDVPMCEYGKCVSKVGEDTHFCKHLDKINRLPDGIYCVICRPVWSGDIEQ